MKRGLRAALRPGACQPFVHGARGALQNSQVAAAFGVGVGVRKKTTLRVNTGFADFGHDLLRTHAKRVRTQLLGILQGREHLLEAPAFGQTDRFKCFFTTHQHAQQAAGGGSGGDFVAAGANLAGLT